MIDVFFTMLGTGGLREKMAELCLARWYRESGVKVHVLSPSLTLPASGKEKRHTVEPWKFQLERRVRADELANSQFYVVADDDCLLPDTDTVLDAVEVAKNYPHFGQFSWWPSNSQLRPWTPGEDDRKNCVNGEVYSDGLVMEHVSVGGIRLLRKGLLPKWPAPPEGSTRYDSIHAQALRDLGYRSGYFRDYLMNHLGRGEGYSCHR